MNEHKERLLTVNDVAVWLNISAAHIRNLIKDGELQAYAMPRSRGKSKYTFRFNVAMVERYLQTHCFATIKTKSETLTKKEKEDDGIVVGIN